MPTSSATAQLVKRGAPLSVAAQLRERGQFPPASDPRGRPMDLSPFSGLTPREKRKRLAGILEFLAAHGDPGAAAEALRHARWEEEMRRGKAPQRIDLNAAGEIKVVDTLSAPAGTPVPVRSRLRPA